MHRWRRITWAGLAAMLVLAGCTGAPEPDDDHFPWHERPTSASTLVPVPTPDGEATAEPDPDSDESQLSIDLIVATLAEQDIRLRRIHDADHAPQIEEGVHYIELVTIPESFHVEPDSGSRESQRVVYGSLTPEGSVDMFLAQLERDRVENPHAEREAIEEAQYWRQDLDGTREPFEPFWRSGDYPGEYPMQECPRHVLTTQMLDEPGHWRLTVWPTEPGRGDVRSFDFEADEEGAIGSNGLSPTHVDCDADFAVIFSDSTYRTMSQTGRPQFFGPGQPALISLSAPHEPHPLEAVPLSTTQSGEVLVAQVGLDIGEVWNLNATGDDSPVLSLPGSEHMEWLHIAASDGHLVVVLRDATPLRSSTAALAYVVLVDLVSSEATVYTRTVEALPNEVPTVASLGDELLVVNFVSRSLNSGMLAIDMLSDTVVLVGGSVAYAHSGYAETSGDLIGFRTLVSERTDAGYVTTIGTEYVIGRWTKGS